MILSIRADLEYTLTGMNSILLQLEAAGMVDQQIIEANIEILTPHYFARVPGEDMIGERIWLQAEDSLTCHYSAKIAVTRENPDFSALPQVEMHRLSGDAVKYLMSSRYSESDKFQSFVEAEFGDLTGGPRIAAIRDWIAAKFEYTPGSSDGQTTAMDTFVQRRGICRDYAHVMVTLARASGIPARMVSVYGIGVEPQDFHAVAEVYLGDDWHLVDATGMCDAASMARIGVGRDAGDVAFMSVFGNGAQMVSQQVSVESDPDAVKTGG